MTILEIFVGTPDRRIYIDNKLYDAHQIKSERQGLEECILVMFDTLKENKISKITADVCFSLNTSCAEFTEIAEIKSIVFKEAIWRTKDDMNRKNKNVYKRVAEAIGLIAWLKNENEHFNKQSDTIRMCTICGNLQTREITDNAKLNNVHLVRWPSDYCFNQECFSHKIWKTINPNYTIPGEIPSSVSSTIQKFAKESVAKVS